MPLSLCLSLKHTIIHPPHTYYHYYLKLQSSSSPVIIISISIIIRISIAISFGINIAIHLNLLIQLLVVVVAMLDPDIHNSALANFETHRRSFVQDLEALARGDTQHRTIPRIRTDLQTMLYTLSMWTKVREGIIRESKCFEEKCLILMGVIDQISIDIDITGPTRTIGDPVVKKMCQMLALHIGALTLDGFSDIDTEAVESSREIELEQRRWEIKHEDYDDERGRKLRVVWVHMYYKVDDCLCGLCTGSYKHTREPTLSPPLPPLDPESSDDSSSSSEEE
ncbi:unnamed protein product [Penicillium glandicola]